MRLQDIFRQETFSFFEGSPRCFIYRHLTDNFCLQFYLTKNVAPHLLRMICKFRISAHPLNVESGRYSNISRSNRICLCCSTLDLEDEFHFIIICSLYSELRCKFIKPYYWKHPSVFKLIQLLTVRNVKEIKNLGTFLFNACEARNLFVW